MIKILTYKENTNANSHAVATFSIQIEKWGGFQIRGMTLFRKDGKSWLAYPNRPYEDEGKKKYYNFVAFEDAKMDATFKEKIFTALNEHIAKINHKPIEVQGELPF
jgi:hypothetical protein